MKLKDTNVLMSQAKPTIYEKRQCSTQAKKTGKVPREGRGGVLLKKITSETAEQCQVALDVMPSNCSTHTGRVQKETFD